MIRSVFAEIPNEIEGNLENEQVVNNIFLYQHPTAENWTRRTYFGKNQRTDRNKNLI
jgi:hypothetical protein